jgi:glycerol kinase
MEMWILSIDQGTTGTAVSLVDEQGHIRFSHDEPFQLSYPQAGWVEQDPEAIWSSVVNGIAAVLRASRVSPGSIVGIGITNQRETTLAWDHQGRALYPAIVWQCRRTASRCHELQSKKELIKSKTGLLPDPYFSATKMEWLLHHVPAVQKAARDGSLHLGTVDSFLIFRLTGGQSFSSDVSNASRTMLLNLYTLTWDKDLLSLFPDLRWEFLPQVRPSQSLFGHTKGLSVLPDGIPIRGVVGDQQAALFGQLAHGAGQGKITFGTGSFILVNTGSQVIEAPAGLLSTVAWQLGEQAPQYALEGGAFICGAAVQWLRDDLGLFEKSEDIERLALSVQDSAGVVFVPALTGMGAPYWQAEARGAFLGLSRSTKKAHVCRAVLEALAHQNADILEIIREVLPALNLLRVDGGASRNNLLMQMQADFSGLVIERGKQLESTTLGAAFIAGLGAGVWSSPESLRQTWGLDQRFQSRLSETERKGLRLGWKKPLQEYFASESVAKV